MASRRGPISIDKIVALRSSSLPLYVLVRQDGSVTASDEVSEDGNDFLTTKMHGDKISFRSIRGDYLSAEGGLQVSTCRRCSADERFLVERMGTQYAFRARCGRYLSVIDRAPWVTLADTPGETEAFQLFSLMMAGVNVGKQLETLERTGSLVLGGLLDLQTLPTLRGEASPLWPQGQRGHELRCGDLAGSSPGLAELAAHPVVMQLAKRLLSPALRLSDMESCRTDADHVRKELEATTWQVVHPYNGAEYPGIVDPRASLTAVWFLDALDEGNSTWAWVKAPLSDGACLPRVPNLSSPEEVEAVVADALPLTAPAGAVWLYVGPVWTSNNVGAGSFWKDYDAQTRYKHLSGQTDPNGQAEQTFRALTDAQLSAPRREEMCPVVVEATYVREYVAPRSAARPHPEALARLGDSERQSLQELCL